MRLGIISDTHGLLRPEAARALSGVDLIVHAGDVGKPEVLMQLKAIAPVFAVRGNVDTESDHRQPKCPSDIFRKARAPLSGGFAIVAHLQLGLR
jgi:putative phosphoesterase